MDVRECAGSGASLNPPEADVVYCMRSGIELRRNYQQYGRSLQSISRRRNYSEHRTSLLQLACRNVATIVTTVEVDRGHVNRR
jgi:hypothetical protein